MSIPTYVVAEAGVNHGGSLERALALVDAAAGSGADAVKFQTFNAARLATATAAKADYQRRTTPADESQFEMLRQLELSDDMHRRILERCGEKGIAFLSSPFDEESLRYLVDGLGLDRIKIPSGEITNGPLLLATAQRAGSVILSTGMATLAEIETALAVLVTGVIDPGRQPANLDEIWGCYTEHGTKPLAGRVVLLHCTTEYPAAMTDVNLRAMDTLRHAFGLEVGFSDHTMGIAAPTAAVARGAVLIEKHLTLDRSLPGPDHSASLEPPEFRGMVAAIREVEAALGDGRKLPVGKELFNCAAIRKSVVAARGIVAGETLDATNLTFKRPGRGVSPMLYWDIVGSSASRDFQVDEPIDR